MKEKNLMLPTMLTIDMLYSFRVRLFQVRHKHPLCNINKRKEQIHEKMEM